MMEVMPPARSTVHPVATFSHNFGWMLLLELTRAFGRSGFVPKGLMIVAWQFTAWKRANSKSAP